MAGSTADADGYYDEDPDSQEIDLRFLNEHDEDQDAK